MSKRAIRLGAFIIAFLGSFLVVINPFDYYVPFLTALLVFTLTPVMIIGTMPAVLLMSLLPALEYSQFDTVVQMLSFTIVWGAIGSLYDPNATTLKWLKKKQ